MQSLYNLPAKPRKHKPRPPSDPILEYGTESSRVRVWQGPPYKTNPHPEYSVQFNASYRTRSGVLFRKKNLFFQELKPCILLLISVYHWISQKIGRSFDGAEIINFIRALEQQGLEGVPIEYRPKPPGQGPIQSETTSTTCTPHIWHDE